MHVKQMKDTFFYLQQMSISYRDHALLLTNILKKKITYHYFHT